MSELETPQRAFGDAESRPDWGAAAAVFLLDRTGRFREANAAAVALVGFDSDELRSMHFTALLSAGDRLAAALQRNDWPLDRALTTALQTQTGQTIAVTLSFSELPLDGAPRIVAVATPGPIVAGDQRPDTKLQVALEQLQLAIETAQMGIWRFDASTGLMEVNEELLEIYGITSDQVEHDMDAFLEQIHPQDRTHVEASMAIMFTGNHVRDIEFRILRPDGAVRHVTVSTQPIYGADGQIREMVGITVDVTQARQREIALKESETFLRAIFDSSLNGIAVSDDAGQVRSANRAVADLFGYRQDELIGFDLRRLQPVDMANIMQNVRRYLTAGRQVGELSFQRPDGERRIVNYHAVRVGEDFNLSILNDITERKRADQALRASEARYRTLFESANDFVFLHEFDEAGNASFFLEVNQHACQRLGYSLAEFRQLRPVDIMSSADLANVPTEADELANARELMFEKQLVTKNSELIPVELHARVLEHQGRQLVLSIGRDISERKQSGAALQKLQQAIDQSPVSVVITDADGTIEYVNPKFCETTGYSAAESLGENPRILKSDLHSAEFYRELWATIAAGKEWRGELRNKKKNGTLYWELASISGVRGENGAITHYVAVKEDITNRKQLEEERVRQERLASVGHLAAGIAHDFNNILASIVLYARLALQSGTLADENQERLVTIDKQAWHASKLIDQILDFSRRGMLEKRTVDLLPLIQEHVKLLQRTLPENIQIELQYGQEPYTVHADPTRMQQIITNLAVNARDAMPDGGLLTVSLARTQVALDPQLLPELPPGDWIHLRLADSGNGIPDDALPYVFEPFFTTKGPGEGSGLGLAQVHGIVGQHGGRIGVTTVKGQGTTFSIYLPAQVPVPAETAAATAELMPWGEGEILLVVEDEPALREALVASLVELNYLVLEAANGTKALQIMEEQGSDIALVLSDVVMPVMGGEALVHALRARSWATPVLLLTGHAGAGDLSALLTAEIAGLLSKPFSMSHLARAIRQALNA